MGKALFAAIPVRAMSDTRLTATQWRVLAAVSWHARPGGNNMGCTASLKKLAEETGLWESHVSTALNDLVEFGYLSRGRSPLDGRKKTYHVNHECAESAAKVFTGGRKYPEEKLTSDRKEVLTDSGEILTPEIPFPERNQSLNSGNTLIEHENICSEANRCREAERDPAESGPPSAAAIQTRVGSNVVSLKEMDVPPLSAFEMLINFMGRCGFERADAVAIATDLPTMISGRLRDAAEAGTLTKDELFAQIERGFDEAANG